jgi:hypothetical protein
MMRRNSEVSPESRTLSPNGFYQAYRHLFDEICVQQEFESDHLKELYIFDRATHVEEPVHLKGWCKVELVKDPVIEREFDLLPEFSIYEREFLTFLLTDVKGKLLRLIGPVGSGKSTFIRYMFEHYLLKQRFFEKNMTVLIDLSKILRTQKEYTYDETVRVVLKEIKNRLAKMQVESHYLIARNEHLLVQFLQKQVNILGPKHVFIVFDNADVFSASFQGHLSEFALNLSTASGCTVILTTRMVNAPNFSDPAKGGAIPRYDMFQRPPLIHKVIERRLNYLIDVKQDFQQERTIRIELDQFTVTFSDVETFVKTFTEFILHDRVRDALESLANFNVRLAFLWTLVIIGSWNLNIPLMVNRIMKLVGFNKKLKPVDAFDTFLLALGMCNHQMYFPSHSLLENLFSAHLSNHENDHFIKYRCLKFCSRSDKSIGKTGLEGHLMNFGYSIPEITEAVNQLLSLPKRLLESDDGQTYNTLKTLRITYAGRYYIHRLVYAIRYVQIVADDIVLPDEVSLHEGNQRKRLSNLLEVLEFMGEKEIEETRRFVDSNGKHNIAVQDYIDIYGKTPLTVNIIRRLQNFLTGRFSSAGNKLGKDFEGSIDQPLLQEAVESASNLQQQFNDIIKHRS